MTSNIVILLSINKIIVLFGAATNVWSTLWANDPQVVSLVDIRVLPHTENPTTPGADTGTTDMPATVCLLASLQTAPPLRPITDA